MTLMPTTSKKVGLTICINVHSFTSYVPYTVRIVGPLRPPPRRAAGAPRMPRRVKPRQIARESSSDANSQGDGDQGRAHVAQAANVRAATAAAAGARRAAAQHQGQGQGQGQQPSTDNDSHADDDQEGGSYNAHQRSFFYILT